jgi:ribonuclease BN (tRNA processing enzyme)
VLTGFEAVRVQIKLKKSTSPPALPPRQVKWRAHIGAGFILIVRAACTAAAVAALFVTSNVLLAEELSGSAAALEVIVLGSGGPAALGRASSSYLVLLHGVPRVIVDAGSGSFVRLGEAHVSLEQLDIVLLTHLHVDHAAELPGLVKARAVSTGQPIHFAIYGPEGRAAGAGAAAFPATSRFVDLQFGANGAFPYLKDFSAPITFSVTDLPVGNQHAQPRTLLTQSSLRISAIAGHHGDAPAIIYRLDYEGRSVVFSGDIDAQGLPALATIARGADLLVFHAVVLDPPGSPSVLYSLHTPPQAIGVLAAGAQVHRLLLSHLSPAVEAHDKEVIASIRRHYRGELQFATDGMRQQP